MHSIKSCNGGVHWSTCIWTGGHGGTCPAHLCTTVEDRDRANVTVFCNANIFWGVWFLRIGSDLNAVSVGWAAVGHMACLVGEAGLLCLFQNSPWVIDIDLQWTACLNIIPNHTSCTLWWICCALFYRQRDMKCIFLTVFLSQPLHILHHFINHMYNSQMP